MQNVSRPDNKENWKNGDVMDVADKWISGVGSSIFHELPQFPL